MVNSKHVFAVLCFFGLTACGNTAKFVQKETHPREHVSVVSEALRPVATLATEVFFSPPSEYRYGRFLVKVSVSGQEVEGGVFTPSTVLPHSASLKHAIFVDYTTKELAYYRRSSAGVYEPVIGYAVVTPFPHKLPQEVVRGMVRRINTAPTWCPPESVRRARPKLHPGCYAFGHPDNAMGVAKFEVSWKALGLDLVRIHGTSGYPQGNFWDEETFGCTRLKNDAILELIDALGPHAVAEGIEVVLMRGTGERPLAGAGKVWN